MDIKKILHPSFVILMTLFFGTSMLVMTPKLVIAQGKELSGRGKAADSNKDGLIQESEARGHLQPTLMTWIAIKMAASTVPKLAVSSADLDAQRRLLKTQAS